MRHGRAVVVTGASSGIGRATCLRMAANGWSVIAAVRNEHDRADLGAHDGVEGVLLDVAVEESISESADEVAELVGDRGLSALVNNAGIVVAGPLEALSRQQWVEQFEVNVFGVADVTRALMPLLDRAVDPRVVVVGSISGRVGAPLLAPYVASKHAVDGMVKCLRREFDGNGPTVSLVEPGAVTTPLWRKASHTADIIDASLTDSQRRRYGRFIAAHRVALAGGERAGVDADVVAAVIENALTSSRPRARYLVGADAKAGGALQRLLPDAAMESIGRVLVRRALADAPANEGRS